MAHMFSINRKKSGFTVVELVVVAPIVIIVISAFILAIISMTGDVLASRESNVLAYSIQDSLNRIEADYKTGTGSRATSITPASPQGSKNDNTPFSGPDTAIINSYVTKNNPMDGARSLLYRNDGAITDCNDPMISGNDPVVMNIVYFISNHTLYRRILMPSDFFSIACDSSKAWQKPSCSASNVGTSQFCASTDMEVMKNVSEFKVTLNKIGAEDAPGAITVSITAEKTSAGRTITQSGTISAVPIEQ
jgi:type II secretory pathway pseudopilin PulG